MAENHQNQKMQSNHWNNHIKMDIMEMVILIYPFLFPQN